MAAFPYPPSPPSSTSSKPRLRLRTVISYQGAVNRGNTLLYLSRPIRTRIYTLALTSDPQYHNIEVPDTGDFNLPYSCEVDHIFRHEVAQLVFKNAVFTIPTDAAIYNFFVWLNEFNAGIGDALLTKLELIGLELFEKGVFASNATRLLKRCLNVKEVTVMIDLRALPFTCKSECRVLDMNPLTRNYDLASLTEMPRLEKVTLSLTPFMALEKRLKSMQQERERCKENGGECGPNVEEFWGLKRWIESNSAASVEVQCPSIEAISGS